MSMDFEPCIYSEMLNHCLLIQQNHLLGDQKYFEQFLTEYNLLYY